MGGDGRGWEGRDFAENERSVGDVGAQELCSWEVVASWSLCCVSSEDFWDWKAETLGTYLRLNPSFITDLSRVLGQVPFLLRASVS